MAHSPVVFLVGRPGAGKGTLGVMLAKFLSWQHLSVGELLRDKALISAANSPRADALCGDLVPSSLSADVLLQAMRRSPDTKGFIVDGFPRSMDNWLYWSSALGQSSRVKGVLLLDCDDETATARCLARGQIRTDDTPTIIARRLEVFHSTTAPAVERLRLISTVVRVNGMLTPTQVFHDAACKLQKLLGVQQVASTNKHLLFVEGNIGSGKSSLMSSLADLPDVELRHEDVEQWKNFEGYNLLDLAYRQPQRWTFVFQSAVLQSCSTILDEVQTVRLRICERSPYSAQFCFARMQRASGALNPAEWMLLKQQFKRIHRQVALCQPSIVYLRTSPQAAFERMRQRGRPEEEIVPLEYLQTLHEMHEFWLKQAGFADDGFTWDIRTLNGDQPPAVVAQEFKSIVKELLD